jgi:hypothetical protein
VFVCLFGFDLFVSLFVHGFVVRYSSDELPPPFVEKRFPCSLVSLFQSQPLSVQLFIGLLVVVVAERAACFCVQSHLRAHRHSNRSESNVIVLFVLVLLLLFCCR